jgi:hypothetical protein
VSEAALSVYRRPDGYYLVVSARTTAGLWQHVAEPPKLLGGASEPADLGSEALDRLAEPRPITPHPRREEWTEARRSSLDPILKSAGVGSWQAFITTATQVDVGRTNETFTVTPMKALPKPQGAFAPDLAGEMELRSPSAVTLGRVILRAFAVSDPS